MSWLGNIIAGALLAGFVFAWIRLRENRMWRQAALSLVRRRPIALSVLAFGALHPGPSSRFSAN